MKPAQHQGNQNRHIHLARQRDREGSRLRRQIGAHQGTGAHGGEQLKRRHGERGIVGGDHAKWLLGDFFLTKILDSIFQG